MSEPRKLPECCRWRPSVLTYLRRVQVLEARDGVIGSVGPVPRKPGEWMNRETGQVFDTIDDAKASVEIYLKP